MTERYEIAVKVISQKGTCHAQQKVGDEWVMGRRSPEGICLMALHTMYPNLRVMMFGGVIPGDANPDVHEETCPDTKNPVVYELKRLRK